MGKRRPNLMVTTAIVTVCERFGREQ